MHEKSWRSRGGVGNLFPSSSTDSRHLPPEAKPRESLPAGCRVFGTGSFLTPASHSSFILPPHSLVCSISSLFGLYDYSLSTQHVPPSDPVHVQPPSTANPRSAKAPPRVSLRPHTYMRRCLRCHKAYGCAWCARNRDCGRIGFGG